MIDKKINPKKLSKHEKGQLIEGAKKRDRQRAELRKKDGNRKREKDVYREYLKKGQEYHSQRAKDRESESQAYAWEAASYVQNRLKGSISIVPSLNPNWEERYNMINWGKKEDE